MKCYWGRIRISVWQGHGGIGRARPPDLIGIEMDPELFKESISQLMARALKEWAHSAAFWVVLLSPIIFNHGPATLRFVCRNKTDVGNVYKEHSIAWRTTWPYHICTGCPICSWNWLDFFGFRVFHCLPNSAEARQQGKMVETQIKANITLVYK